MTFTVIDKNTGHYPDCWEIALKEEWAKNLCYCDIEGFAIEEDGTLVLLDECGKVAYCPEGRFRIIPEPPRDENMKCEYCHTDLDGYIVPIDKNGHIYFQERDRCHWVLCIKACGWYKDIPINFCPMCGRQLVKPPKEE